MIRDARVRAIYEINVQRFAGCILDAEYEARILALLAPSALQAERTLLAQEAKRAERREKAKTAKTRNTPKLGS